MLASSASVYAPTCEAIRLGEQAVVNPPAHHGMSKLAAEELCRYYGTHHGVKTTILRLFNVYGPGQPETFLLPYAIRQLVAQEPVVLQMPEAVRDWLYVSDAARAFVLACMAPPSGVQVFNVGTGQGVCVRTVVERLTQSLGVAARIELPPEGSRPTDAVIADPSAIDAALAWQAHVLLEQGLQLTANASVRKPASTPS